MDNLDALTDKILEEKGKDKHRALYRKLTKVRILYEKGNNLSQISSELGLFSVLKENTLRQYLVLGCSYNIFDTSAFTHKPIKKYDSVEKTIDGIINSVLSGITDVDEIANSISRSPITVLRYGSELGLGLINRVPLYLRVRYKNKPEIDKLIGEGLTLSEIGKSVGRTKEHIRQYINSTKQHDRWVENKKKAGKFTEKITEEMSNLKIAR